MPGVQGGVVAHDASVHAAQLRKGTVAVNLDSLSRPLATGETPHVSTVYFVRMDGTSDIPWQHGRTVAYVEDKPGRAAWMRSILIDVDGGVRVLVLAFEKPPVTRPDEIVSVPSEATGSA